MSERRRKILSVEGLSKSYSGVEVLHGIDFDLYEGEVHCVCGENGAGKSTLIKAVAGAISFDSGMIEIDGKRFGRLSPELSLAHGVQTIYQENDLVAHMSIAENIFIGQERVAKGKFVSRSRTLDDARRLVREYGINIDPSRMVHSISVAEEQYVKILKALARESRILILDEPTSMFNISDANNVLELVKRISRSGIGVIYISHHLSEVVEIADRVTVLRDGSLVATISNRDRDIDVSRIASMMVGRSVEVFYQKTRCGLIGDTVLDVRELRRRRSDPPLSFSIRAGEILGVAGMVGSGRSEMAMCLFGAEKRAGGTVVLNGREVSFADPSQAIDAGLVLVPEDRQKQGVNLSLSIGENLIMTIIRKIARFFYYPRTKVMTQTATMEHVGIKAQSPFVPVSSLSGGNQQKVVFGKWINTNAKVFVFDEPTRGVDVNSKAELYKLMCSLADEGKAILLVSSDMPELIALSDRILVMRNNRLTAELTGSDITEENIIVQAIGA